MEAWPDARERRSWRMEFSLFTVLLTRYFPIQYLTSVLVVLSGGRTTYVGGCME